MQLNIVYISNCIHLCTILFYRYITMCVYIHNILFSFVNYCSCFLLYTKYFVVICKQVNDFSVLSKSEMALACYGLVSTLDQPLPLLYPSSHDFMQLVFTTIPPGMHPQLFRVCHLWEASLLVNRPHSPARMHYLN